GNGGYTYAWNNGETTQQITDLNAGTYFVTVTDSRGCSSTCSVIINEPAEVLSCSSVEDSPVICSGESNGVATVTPTGGNGGYIYNWDNGENTQQATALNAGIHIVTVTDFRGCSTTCSVIINQPAADLTCTTIEDSPVVCHGESNGIATVTPAGGNGGYIYNWDNGENTQQATALNAGIHIVTVTDFKGCTSSCSVTINEPADAVSCTVVEDSSVVCNGESNGRATVTPFGGNGVYTYLWDNSETTQQATSLNAGIHTVTVTDSNGCTSSCSVTINQPESVLCTVIEDSPVICNGESNGIATVTPYGGNGMFTYLWDNAEITQQATALDAGLHTVTVTDSNGCTSSCSVTINEPSEIIFCTVIEDSPVICHGESNGIATVTPTGGNGSYTYIWDNGEITQQAIALNEGLHVVTVTDIMGCFTTCSVMINQPSAPMSCTTVEDSPLTCYGGSNGVATVTPAGGNGGYTYVWDNGETTQQATALNGGIHFVTVTDFKGCTSSCSVNIFEPALDIFCTIVEDSPVVCNGESNGVASVMPSGGTGGYTYTWDNGETTQQAIALDAGLHIVTVTDSRGCTTTCSIDINDPSILTCTVMEDPPLYCNNVFNGVATVTPMGGNGGYTYIWDNGETTQQASTLTPGNHSVTVTDSNGCTSSCNVNITAVSNPVTLNDPPDVCLNGFDLNYIGSPVPEAGTVGVFTTSAPAGLTDHGDGTATLDLDIAGEGTYDVTYTYTDSLGCQNYVTNSVSIFALPTATINDPDDVCRIGSLLNFVGEPTPGVGENGIFTSTAITGLTDNGDGTATLDPDSSGPGIYDITYSFIDINGCQDFATSTVEVFDTLPNVIVLDSSVCGNPLFGTNSIDLNNTIISGPLTGTWSDTDGSGSLIGSTFTANPAMEGSSYDFTYTITGPGPIGSSCQSRSFVITIDVDYCNLDVAMIKTTSVTSPVNLNQVLTFDYTICNQGFTIIDSLEITDYIPSCYGFVPNNGWVASGSSAVRTLTISNGGIPAGGLLTPANAPDNCITISLDLSVTCGDPAALIGYAEITAHKDSQGNTEDIDSSPGSDSALERLVLPDDLNDDSFIDTNEDDHDVANVPIVDVALRMTTLAVPPFNYGDPIDFVIEVINQGNVDLTNVQITDHIPCGYAYDPINNGTWIETGGIATTTIPSLDSGENTYITLTLILLERGPTCPYNQAWNNEAEVSQMFDDSLNNVSLEDFDSTANGVLGDDAGGVPNTPSDDAIDGNGTGPLNGILSVTDEDDHDPMQLEFYDLQITKIETSSGPYSQGSIVTFALVIENQGSLPAANIIVSDIPDLGLNFLSNDSGINPNVNEIGTGEWEILALAPDATETINVTFLVSNTYQGLMLNNFTQIIQDDGEDLDSDPNLYNSDDENGDGDPYDDDEDVASIDIVQFYDLSLTKTEFSTGPYRQGDLIVYEIAVHNDGTLNASNITVLDTPQPGLEFVSDNSSMLSNVSSSVPMQYLINTLNITEAQVIRLTFRINAYYQGFTITNDAQIISDDGDDHDSDPNTGPMVDENSDGDGDDDDEDSLTLHVLQTYDLTLEKMEESIGPYMAGDYITYRIEITNQGSLHAYNTEIIDQAGIGLTFISDSYNANVIEIAPQRYLISSLSLGATETVLITYQVEEGFQGSDVINRAQIVVDDGNDLDSNPDTDYSIDEDSDGDGDDDDEDELSIAIFQIYDLEITKNLTTAGTIRPGDDVTFLINLNNTGTLNAANIEITEFPDSEFTFVSSTADSNGNIIVVSDNVYNILDLPFGTSESFEITYNISSGYSSEIITNNIEITADNGDDHDSNPESNYTLDEDNDSDGYDDDEDFSNVSVLIGYEIGDYVWHDLNGNGIQDNNEPGLEGWKVTLYNHLGFVVDVTETDALGYYLFEEVYPGKYYLGLELQNEFVATLHHQDDSELDNDIDNSKGLGTTNTFDVIANDYSKDLGVYKCAKIGELVWFDYNENDLKDLTENGINGMKVELYRQGPLGWTIYSVDYTGHKPNTGSEDGYFKFCVRPGKYYLKFLNPPETLVTVVPNQGSEDIDSDVTNKFGPGTTDDFTVISGDEFCKFGAGYYPMGSIGDYVWSDDNDNGMRESGEQGIEGVVVNAYNSFGVQVASAISDENGIYVIDYLVKDQYFLEVEPPLGMTISIPNAGDDNLDSDIDNSNGINTTQLYQVNPGDHIGNVDFGLSYGVLPIEWVDIWGENRENHNFIEWTVTSEINVSHYEMQVPDPNNNFEWETIGVIDYVESNNIENVYNYKDYQSRIGEYISYRVKQLDINGGFSYSKIVLIENKNGKFWKPIISLNPNPPVDQLTITLELPKRINKLSGSIYDQTGKLIKSNILSQSSIEAGKHNFQININSLPAGIYVINLQLDHERYIERILIL
ncbi:MAG: DUF11 domain-containing protein, partial [Saprospiraceae bacterium]|nr:DUF11 domain-containing protein [Saprospiraceae bacterium]